MAAWERDPEAGRAELLGISDPLIQLAVLRGLAGSHPGELAALCPALTGAPARECRQLSGRPHLWSQNGSRLGSLPTDEVSDPWAELPGILVDCDDDSCRLTAALSAGAGGDGPGICAGIQTPKWRRECFFRLGEQSPDPGLGAKLCLGAGSIAERCLGHISRSLSTPPLSLADAAGWAALQDRIQAAAGGLPEPLASRLADRIWAESLLASYSAADRVTGDPLDHTPASAKSHILAAAAWRLVTTERHSGLEAWLAALDAALSRRGAGHDPSARPGATTRGWEELLPGEEGLAWVAYLRDQRRAVGETEESERIICLLEASARSPRPDPELLRDALSTEDRAVRWTAARLSPGHPGLPQLIGRIDSDPDPLVRQRAPEQKTR